MNFQLNLQTVHLILMIIGEIVALVGFLVPVFVKLHKISAGTKCQLRSEMLRIYYHHKETEKIRQYEYENFIYLYEAYKALKGNSFIDKIHSEVKEWEIVS